MLKFETEDKDLLVWIKGVTKTPDNLTQDDLVILQKNGDPRVIEPKTVTKEKVTAA